MQSRMFFQKNLITGSFVVLYNFTSKTVCKPQAAWIIGLRLRPHPFRSVVICVRFLRALCLSASTAVTVVCTEGGLRRRAVSRRRVDRTGECLLKLNLKVGRRVDDVSSVREKRPARRRDDDRSRPHVIGPDHDPHARRALPGRLETRLNSLTRSQKDGDKRPRRSDRCDC